MRTPMEEFRETFKAAKWVSTPLIVIRSADPASTMHLIGYDLFDPKKNAYPIVSWDIVDGFKPVVEAGKPVAQILAGQDQSSFGRREPTTALTKLHSVPAETIVFFANAHRYMGDTDVAQAIYNLRAGFAENRRTLVLLTIPGSRVPAELSEHVLVLDEPLPTREDLLEVVQDTIRDTRAQNKEMAVVAPRHIQQATDALMGLTVFAAEQTVAMSLELEGLNLERVWNRKVQVIQQTPGLSVWKGGQTFADLAGNENVKDYLRMLLQRDDPTRAIVFLDEIEKHLAGHGTDSSGVKTEMVGTLLTWMQDRGAEGLIFLGPTGTGKSDTAKAAGNLVGIPTIAFDFSSMQASLVGQSGQNLRNALQIVDAISQGKALFIATSNNISSLPPELRRRFNKGTFFFDLPDQDARSAIWDLHCAKYGVTGERPLDTDWSGSDIHVCCQNASQMKIPLQRAAQFISPVGISGKDQIRQLRLQASGKYIDAAKPGIYEFNDSQTPLAGTRVARSVKLSR
jgi:hypothetical protein